MNKKVTDIKIVFMGTPEFAVPSLKALYHEGFEILSVVTQPDRPRGRGRSCRPSPVKVSALDLGLSILQPEKASSPEFIEEICALKPDFLVVVAYGQILKKSLLECPTIMPVNVHGSLLPKYRGAAPIQWSILNGDETTGITIMQMDEGMDTGPILLMEEVSIGTDETFGELYNRLSQLGARLLVHALKEVANGKLSPKPQPTDGVSYAPPIKKELLKIDWNESSSLITRKIRAFDPRPGAWTVLLGERVRLFSPEIVDFSLSDLQDAIPGQIISTSSGKLIVRTGDGAVGVSEIHPPGKRRMAVSDFLRGRKVEVGTRLGE
ncbi:Methionyl-tRNA formyltransferase [Dissulfuribacter thermophilus]|uniref:Methionyl-tRNA formyltransferase n=1 Tax=Dissulfuribacter thermophilus TaxID=1156395 RepID=A0A1B9F7Q8_9BACT|nr:methionyl-tRNA formyltransferase [Dissulfuribacter thermophilus]OCC15801.1 Methionyl-tRNA formyltransferase [Dissulfuribacter thermophilus]